MSRSRFNCSITYYFLSKRTNIIVQKLILKMLALAIEGGLTRPRATYSLLELEARATGGAFVSSSAMQHTCIVINAVCRAMRRETGSKVRGSSARLLRLAACCDDVISPIASTGRLNASVRA